MSPELTAVSMELGIPLDGKPSLTALAQDMLKEESLPEGWTASFDPGTSRRVYTHAATGATRDTHPLIDYYRGAAFMEVGGYKQMVQAEAQRPPTDDEVSEMCEYLGVVPGEDPYLVEVAAMAISAPLPPGWEEVEGEDGGSLFKNTSSGVVSPNHPLDAYFVELLARRRAELGERGAGVVIKSAMSQQRLSTLSMSSRSLQSQQDSASQSEAAAAAAAGGSQGQTEEVHRQSLSQPQHILAPPSRTSAPLAKKGLLPPISEAGTSGVAAGDGERGGSLVLYPPPLPQPHTPAQSTLPLPSLSSFHPVTAQPHQVMSGPTHPNLQGASGSGSLGSDSRGSGAAGSSNGHLHPQSSQGAGVMHSTPGLSQQGGGSQAGSGWGRRKGGKGKNGSKNSSASAGSKAQTPEEDWYRQQAAAMEEVEGMKTQLARAQAERAALQEEEEAWRREREEQERARQQQQQQQAEQEEGQQGEQPQQQEQQQNQDLYPYPVQEGNLEAIQALPHSASQLDPAAAGDAQAQWSQWQEWQETQQAVMGQQVWAGQGGGAEEGEGGEGGNVECEEMAVMIAAMDDEGVQGSKAQAVDNSHGTEPPPPPPPPQEVANRPSRERIRVALRARPLTDSKQEVSAWVVDSVSHTVHLKDQLTNVYRFAGSPGRVFQYDLVLGPDSSTESLFTAHVQPLVDAALRGFNACVFAYGQTGSGKTHTIFGTRGLGPAGLRTGTLGLSLAHLFGAIEMAAMPPSTAASSALMDPLHAPHSAHSRHPLVRAISGATRSSAATVRLNQGEVHTVKLSMLELYNEQLRDLLAPASFNPSAGGAGGGTMLGVNGAPLILVDDPRMGIRVQGLTEVSVVGFSRAMALVEEGHSVRAVGATALNQQSSRSHTIVRVVLESRGPPPLTGGGEGPLLRTALMHWVDLAGSERLAKTGSTGVRFVEGTNINLSLLMLGTVIARLAEAASKSKGGASDAFIPYRNSKLTRLLQPCLGGSAHTAVVATINPSHRHVDETLNTLMFAQRAMAVINTVQMNKVTARGTGANSALVYELKAEVAALKAQLRTAQTQAQLVLPAAAIDPSAGPAPGQSGASGLPNAPTPQVPLPDLAASQLAEVAVRLDQLEFDKAVLLDRLEAVTGQPQGGVWDDLPPTPPGLNLPSERPGRKAGGNAAPRVTAEMAVKSIARIAAMGRATDAAGKVARLASLATPANGNKGGSPGGSDAPEAVVIAVRRLKAERDELRKRDHRLRGQLSGAREQLKALEPFAQAREAVEDCVTMLEDIVGAPAAPNAEDEGGDADQDGGVTGDMIGRLREGVEAVVMLASELSAMQRQLHTAHMLQAAAEARAAELESLWRETNARESLGLEGLRNDGWGSNPTSNGAGGRSHSRSHSHGQGPDMGTREAHPMPPALVAASGGEEEQESGAKSPSAPPPPPPAPVPAPAPAPVTQPVTSPKPDSFFGSLFGRRHAAPAAPTSKPAPPAPPAPPAQALQPTAEPTAQPEYAHTHRTQPHKQGQSQGQEKQSPEAAAEISELKQVIRDQDRQVAALKEELGVVKAELSRWRGFTDMQEIMGGPAAAATAGDASATAEGQLPGVVVVGSMAVRAARESRYRAGMAEAELLAVQEERDALRERLEALEQATGIQGLADGGPDERVDRDHEQQGGASPRGNGDRRMVGGAGRPGASSTVDRANKLRAHVMSLTREVAALTRERDSLLGLVLQAAAAAQQGNLEGPGQGGQMKPNLVSQVFLSNPTLPSGVAGQGGDPVSLEALMAPPLMLPAPAGGRGRQQHSRARSISPGRAARVQQPSFISSPQARYGQGVSLPPAAAAGVGQRRRPKGGKRGGAHGNHGSRGGSGAVPLEAPRPIWDSAPVPVEVAMKLQKHEDRGVMRGDLSPLRGAMSDSPLVGGVVGSVRDADLLNLKRKAVAAEKARKDSEQKAAQEVKAAQAQVAAITRQAAAAGRAHADALRDAQEVAEAQIAKVKADAANAITALMQENARLKTVWNAPGIQFPMPAVVAPVGRHSTTLD